jgi:alkanesulfonate monooxygenase SsuD/methylene tetrahydromethanopterin reductase-like flavin-dependent oxidoreductase (luciferase family)
MAAFMASIDAMTEGRAFLDIGSGDSAVYNIGLAPASRARMADYISCVRDLIATGEGHIRRSATACPLVWRGGARADPDHALCRPKTLHLGGRLFDGVIAGTGLLPEVISDTIERVAAGARAAARDPSEVEVWFTTRSSLDADRDKAIERIHASADSDDVGRAFRLKSATHGVAIARPPGCRAGPGQDWSVVRIVGRSSGIQGCWLMTNGKCGSAAEGPASRFATAGDNIEDM